jgi:hypothetical protein
MKPCDYVEKTPVGESQRQAKPCGKVAAVQSSLGKRHRCPEHGDGIGWKPIEKAK